MRKKQIKLLALLLSLSFMPFSCVKQGNIGDFEFDKVQVNKTAHLFGDTAKPGANIIVDFTYVSSSSDKALQDSINAYITAACFGDRFVDENITGIAELYANTYINEYRQDLEPMYIEEQQTAEKDHEDEETISSWYSYYKGIESSVMHYKHSLLVYRIDLNEYTGGAHGMYNSIFLNFDLAHTHLLTLSDLFVGDYQDMLSDLLWNQLIADKKATSREELEDMGYGSMGDLIPTENFFLSETGITFYYNVYEFTPYVMGAVEIKLPYQMIQHILADDSIIDDLRN